MKPTIVFMMLVMPTCAFKEHYINKSCEDRACVEVCNHYGCSESSCSNGTCTCSSCVDGKRSIPDKQIYGTFYAEYLTNKTCKEVGCMDTCSLIECHNPECFGGNCFCSQCALGKRSAFAMQNNGVFDAAYLTHKSCERPSCGGFCRYAACNEPLCMGRNCWCTLCPFGKHDGRAHIYGEYGYEYEDE